MRTHSSKLSQAMPRRSSANVTLAAVGDMLSTLSVGVCVCAYVCVCACALAHGSAAEGIHPTPAFLHLPFRPVCGARVQSTQESARQRMLASAGMRRTSRSSDGRTKSGAAPGRVGGAQLFQEAL